MSALHCFFCGGKECKYENWKLWTGEKYQGVNAIDGLFSNWITNNILAMQRPSTRLISEYNLIEVFKEKKIGAIFNLQSCGEHLSCGDGLEQSSGFSYLPETFVDSDIKYYNFGWTDMDTPDINLMLTLVTVMAHAMENLRVKIAVHCHAGLGRTGLAIACCLIYSENIPAEAAILIVRGKRPLSIQTRKQSMFVIAFEKHLKRLKIIFPHIVEKSQKVIFNIEPMNFSELIDNQRKLLRYSDLRYLRYIPKLVHVIINRLLIICAQDELQWYNTLDSIVQFQGLEQRSKRILAYENEINNSEWGGIRNENNPKILIDILLDWFLTLKEPFLNDEKVNSLSSPDLSWEQKYDIVGKEELETINLILKFLRQIPSISKTSLDTALEVLTNIFTSDRASLKHFIDVNPPKPANSRSTDTYGARMFDKFKSFKSSSPPGPLVSEMTQSTKHQSEASFASLASFTVGQKGVEGLSQMETTGKQILCPTGPGKELNQISELSNENTEEKKNLVLATTESTLPQTVSESTNFTPESLLPPLSKEHYVSNVKIISDSHENENIKEEPKSKILEKLPGSEEINNKNESIRNLLHHIYKSFTSSESNSAISTETNSKVITGHQWSSPVELLQKMPKESQTENLAIKFEPQKYEGKAKGPSLSYSASSLFSKTFVGSDNQNKEPPAALLNRRKSSSVGFLPMDKAMIPKGLTDLGGIDTKVSAETIPEETVTLASQ